MAYFTTSRKMNLGLLSDLGGPSGPWLATKDTLKTQVQTYGGIPADMSTSPTITESASSSATLTGATIANNDSRLRYMNGDQELTGPTFPRNTVYSANCATLADSSRTGLVAALEFDTDCPQIEVEVYRSGLGTSFNVYVDGQKSANSYSAISDGNLRWVKIDLTPLGATVRRTIRLECIGRGAWGRLKLDTTGTIYTPASATRLKLCMLADSFMDGTGTSNAWDQHLGARAARLLGFNFFRSSALGGTGYVAANTGVSPNKPSLASRLSADATSITADVYIIALGLNDTMGIASTVADCLDQIRSTHPHALIYGINRWNPSAPTPRSGTAADVAAEITSSWAGRGGMKLFDPDLVSYTKSDATHPDLTGHDTLGDWLANQIKADLGIAA